MALELVDRLLELPYRVRSFEHARPVVWAIPDEVLGRLRLDWPTRLQWEGARPIVSAIRMGLGGLGILREVDFPQPHQGVVMLRARLGDRNLSVALDYFDKPEVINQHARRDSDVYIKLQFLMGGYGDSGIVAGGYPVTFAVYYKFLKAFRALAVQGPTHDVTGRFGFAFQEEIRRKAIGMLSSVPTISYIGASGKVRYSRFLRESATSKLCLHLPGNGPFTHRVAEYLGLGSCMVSPRFPVELNAPLVPGVHYIEVKEDLDDLIDVCRDLLADEPRRVQVARAGRDFFDKNLHVDEHAGYLCRKLLEYLT